jgi:hypothetical protein
MLLRAGWTLSLSRIGTFASRQAASLRCALPTDRLAALHPEWTTLYMSGEEISNTCEIESASTSTDGSRITVR